MPIAKLKQFFRESSLESHPDFNLYRLPADWQSAADALKASRDLRRLSAAQDFIPASAWLRLPSYKRQIFAFRWFMQDGAELHPQAIEVRMGGSNYAKAVRPLITLAAYAAMNPIPEESRKRHFPKRWPLSRRPNNPMGFKTIRFDNLDCPFDPLEITLVGGTIPVLLWQLPAPERMQPDV